MLESFRLIAYTSIERLGHDMHYELCHYAYPGTMGHECGAPAQYAKPIKSTMTVSGTYYSYRCAPHMNLRDGNGEPMTIGKVEPLELPKHRNVWK